MRDSNGSIVRAIRGPIILITVGGLFVLNNFTRFGFEQTWPVILIVIGLLSLLKRGVDTSAPPPPPPPRSAPPPPPGPSYSQSQYGGVSGASWTPRPPDSGQTAPPPPAGEPAKGGFGTSAPARPDVPPASPTGGTGGTA